MIYRDLIPPVVTKALHREGRVFASYAEALQASTGYMDQDLASVVLAKTKANTIAPDQTTLLAVAIASIVTDKKSLRVLDFGGAFGTAYLMVQGFLGLDFKWAVVESPTFAQLGESTPELRFFDSVDRAREWLGGIDLVYSSGALQYTESPEGMLSTLVRLGAPVLALLRCAISDGERVVHLQTSRLSENGPGPLPQGVTDRAISYPRTFAIRPAMRAQGYRLVSHGSECLHRFTVGGEPVITGESFIFTHQR